MQGGEIIHDFQGTDCTSLIVSGKVAKVFGTFFEINKCSHLTKRVLSSIVKYGKKGNHWEKTIEHDDLV